MTAAYRLIQQRQAAAAAQRRQQIALWLEKRTALLAVRPRSEDEARAQYEALALLDQAQTGAEVS